DRVVRADAGHRADHRTMVLPPVGGRFRIQRAIGGQSDRRMLAAEARYRIVKVVSVVEEGDVGRPLTAARCGYRFGNPLRSLLEYSPRLHPVDEVGGALDGDPIPGVKQVVLTTLLDHHRIVHTDRSGLRLRTARGAECSRTCQ